MRVMNVLIALIVLMIIPLILFLMEYRLAKSQSRMAVILPVVVLWFSVIILYAAIISAIMFVIYFVVKYLEKEKQKKLSELEKMNIHDLE